MKTVDLQTISDLKANPQVKSIIRGWDVCQELRDWVGTLRNSEVTYETRFTWGGPRKDRVFHPSSIYNPCDMYLYLELVGAHKVEKTDPRRVMLFNTGTVIHEQLQYYQHTMATAKDYDYVDEYSVWRDSKLAEELHLGGSADGLCKRVLQVPWSGGRATINLRALFEYKTISSDGFSRLRGKPDIGYVRQTHSYMASTDVPLTVLLYYNKNDSNIRSFFVFFDPKIWNPIEARLRYLVKLAERYEVPERNVGKTCNWCKFLEDCKPPIKRQRRGAPRMR